MHDFKSSVVNINTSGELYQEKISTVPSESFSHRLTFESHFTDLLHEICL